MCPDICVLLKAEAASSWSNRSKLLLDVQLRISQEGAPLSGNRRFPFADWGNVCMSSRSSAAATEAALHLPFYLPCKMHTVIVHNGWISKLLIEIPFLKSCDDNRLIYRTCSASRFETVCTKICKHGRMEKACSLSAWSSILRQLALEIDSLHTSFAKAVEILCWLSFSLFCRTLARNLLHVTKAVWSEMAINLRWLPTVTSFHCLPRVPVACL